MRGSRRDPPPKARGQYTLCEEADLHTKEPDRRKQPEYSPSEPAYETREQSEHRHARPPPPSHFGPHFEKGPAQDELWNARGREEVWQSERQPGPVTPRKENIHRAHSFQPPVRQHQYSQPYEKRPEGGWTPQMKAERREYHRLSDTKVEGATKAIQKAKKTPVGRGFPPTEAHGKAIQEGITAAQDCRNRANQATQARAGFMQKYPRGYEEDGLAGHEEQVRIRRSQADKVRKTEQSLRDKHGRWEGQMAQQSGASGSSG